jgi:hypothetical protein
MANYEFSDAVQTALTGAAEFAKANSNFQGKYITTRFQRQ